MTEERIKAQKIVICKGDIWVTNKNRLEIIDYSEKHKIVTYKINQFFDSKEAPAIQIQLSIVKSGATLLIK